MKNNVPDCTTEDHLRHPLSFPAVNQNKAMGGEEDLMELLWQNGSVIMHSQNNRKVPGADSQLKQAQKTLENSSNLIQDDENASWFHFPLDDPFAKDFEFFSDIVMADSIVCNKISNRVEVEEQENVQQCKENALPPAKMEDLSRQTPASSLKKDSVLNFPLISGLVKPKVTARNEQLKKGSESLNNVAGPESSVMTLGSSKCASNHIVTDIGPSRTLSSGTECFGAGGMQQDARTMMKSEGVQTNEVTVTVSSSGSEYSAERITPKRTRNQSHKRKARESEDFVSQSKEADCDESVEPKKPAKHRSRAAEMHNLAERRRRDRINEKMKALQELIPHCNKTDKVSMLDDTIEYLKSLQMQIQMMWMGGSLSQMMLPGVPPYFPGMGMGLAHVPLPAAQNAGHSVASGSTGNQILLSPSTGLNMLNFSSQMQSVVPESFGCYLGFQQMQPQPQALGFTSYGPPILQQNHSTSMPGSNVLPGVQEAPSETHFMANLLPTVFTNDVDH